MPFDGIVIDPVTQLLIKAKATLLERGWSSNGRGPERRVCAAQALNHAALAAGFSLSDDTVMMALDAFGRAIGYKNRYVITLWNDDPCRVVDDITAAYDKTIADRMSLLLPDLVEPSDYNYSVDDLVEMK